MFQKLYRHLEEVNSTLHRQEAAADTSSTYDKEILQQLQQLNEAIKAGNRELQLAVKKPGRLFPLVVLVVACLAVGAVIVLDLRLTEMTRTLADTRENLHHQQLGMSAQITRLDSIIGQENQALLELKDLNKMSVHTFMRLRYRMDRTDQLIRVLQTDSGHTISRIP